MSRDQLEVDELIEYAQDLLARQVCVTIQRGGLRRSYRKRRIEKEALPGIEPGYDGFAIRCLSAWLKGRLEVCRSAQLMSFSADRWTLSARG
jgi:hypothetical protein